MTKVVSKVDSTKLQATTIDFNLSSKWLNFAQVTASSVAAYSKGIKRLQEYFTAKKIIAPCRADMVAYREYLGKKYQPTTANLYLTVAKLFLTFLQVEGYISVNPCEHVKGFKISSEHKKTALSVEMTKSVVTNFKTSTLAGARDKALYLLMTTCGLRCVEVQRANISDIEVVDGVIRLHIQGKGHTQKDCAVNIPEGVYAVLQSYLDKRANYSDDSPLFASISRRNYGERLTTVSISRIIKNALRASGYDSTRLTAHSLRHTTATTALQFGASLREVQQLLRHKKIDTTCIYLHELNALKNKASTFAANAFGF